MKSQLTLSACIIGLSLTLTVLSLLGRSLPTPVRAAAAVRYVATTGSDIGDCTTIVERCRTIQYAIGVAAPLDEIWVAQGIYTNTPDSVVVLTRTLVLLGGWNSDFTDRDPRAYPVTLDAQRNGRVVYIAGSISPTLDGFIITGGNADGEATGTGYGGGIYSSDASPIIQNNVIVSNVASISPTSGSGGGIYLYNAPASALISGNQVLSNSAYSASWSQGGGGLYLSYSDATVQGNLIQDNTCNRAGGGIYVGCCGAPYIVDNEIRFNYSGNNGGGIYARFSGRPHIGANLIADNAAVWYGGAIMAVNGSQPTIDANRIFSNTASNSAGVIVETSAYYTVVNNVIAHNNSGGIRVWDTTRYGLVAHNTIVFNPGSDGGIRLADGYITPTVLNNIVISNSYGIRAHAEASGTLDYNDVWGNTTQDYDLPGALEPGPHDIQANPRLVNPAADDFHIRCDSPVIDRGMNAGVTSDIDGDARIGAPDLGADEYRGWCIYLPLILRQ